MVCGVASMPMLSNTLCTFSSDGMPAGDPATWCTVEAASRPSATAPIAPDGVTDSSVTQVMAPMTSRVRPNDR